MATNDIVLLDSLLERLSPRYGDSLERSERFELFVFDQLLKRFDPTYDDLSHGWVDGGNDGGLDGFFIYVDGRPITGPASTHASLISPRLDLIIATARTSPRFEQQP